jgi:hypothetical protein
VTLLGTLFNAIPWWLWLLFAAASVPSAMFAAATALGLASATGTHHHALSRRQRRMGRMGYVAALAAVPGSIGLGVLALAAMVWALLR